MNTPMLFVSLVVLCAMQYGLFLLMRSFGAIGNWIDGPVPIVVTVIAIAGLITMSVIARRRLSDRSEN